MCLNMLLGQSTKQTLETCPYSFKNVQEYQYTDNHKWYDNFMSPLSSYWGKHTLCDHSWRTISYTGSVTNILLLQEFILENSLINTIFPPTFFIQQIITTYRYRIQCLHFDTFIIDHIDEQESLFIIMNIQSHCDTASHKILWSGLETCGFDLKCTGHDQQQILNSMWHHTEEKNIIVCSFLIFYPHSTCMWKNGNSIKKTCFVHGLLFILYKCLLIYKIYRLSEMI